ncbi:MAG TPA: HEAT repeat domain-containing protein [Terriglobia bacterium]|nr:HEAT repeat domain-containing protein [Terriglobia bacterium]
MRVWMLMMLGTALAFGQTKPAESLQKCQKILDAAIQDKNPDGRKGAAEALSLVGVKDNALQYLAPMLDDHDVSVRIAVVVTLGDFKDNRTLTLLKKALRDPVPEVDLAAAKVLYQLHDPDGVRFLLDVVSGDEKASSSYLSKEKRSALRMLHTPTKLFIYIGLQAAGFAPVPGLGYGISSAQGILSDPDSSARAATLLLIGSSKDPTLADEVESALSDKEWSVRAAAAHLVAMHPFPQFREKLVPLLDDKKDAVRVRAAAAYIRLQHVTKILPVK